jgi:hypothetical protein
MLETGELDVAMIYPALIMSELPMAMRPPLLKAPLTTRIIYRHELSVLNP